MTLSAGALHQLDRTQNFRTLTLAVGAEAGNAIPVTVQLANAAGTAVAEVGRWHVEAVGELTTGFRLAVSGAGTASISATAKSQLAFATGTTGAAIVTVTDVSAASTATVVLAFRPLDGPGEPVYAECTFA